MDYEAATLNHFFFGRTYPDMCVAVSDLVRLTEGVYTCDSIVRDIRSGHLEGESYVEGGKTRWYVPIGPAREYMRNFKPASALPLTLPPGWEEPDLVVYFIQSGPFIKIGRAAYLEQRIKQLRNGNPHPMECIHRIQVADGAQADLLERRLHGRFADYRHSGEWFHDCADIRDFIARNKDFGNPAAA